MVDLPWIGWDSASEEGVVSGPVEGDPIVRCECQDGTVYVFQDEVYIERHSRSKFNDKRVPMAEINDVKYSKRLIISFLQIVQAGIEPDEETRFSTPVDENTVHLGRGKRACARRARDQILAQIESV